MELDLCLSHQPSCRPEPPPPAAARSTIVFVAGLILAALIAALGVRPDADPPPVDISAAASHTWIAEAFPTGQAGFAHADRDR